MKINDSEGFEITRDIFFPEQDTEDSIITVDKLNAGHVYEVMVSYITDVGESASSGTSAKFNLPATSAPRGLTVVKATISSLHITWLPPAETAPGVNKDNITYNVLVSGAPLDDVFHGANSFQET